MSELVLVTGASAGIGQAVAERFVAEGHQVILTARRRDRLEALTKKLGSRATAHPLDVTDSQAVADFVAELGPVSVLVNNAGCAHGMAPAWECSMDDWLAMVDLNINGLLRLTRAVLPGMVERDHGHIINLGSVAGTYPYPGGHVYGGTKAFVEQFSLNLRCDLHGKNIRVTNIEPGMVETEFSLVRFAGDRQKADAVYEGFEPLTAEDIAEAVFWCASLPARVNINRLEVMPTMQSSAGFRVHRQ
ncbi:MAG: SDR family oxidoreductase [Vulcanimicrobiota bacterium]